MSGLDVRVARLDLALACTAYLDVYTDTAADAPELAERARRVRSATRSMLAAR